MLLGIRELLKSGKDLIVVGEERTAEAAKEACLALQPNIVVVDAQTLAFQIDEFVQEVKSENHGVHVIVLACAMHGKHINKLLKFGIEGYLMKEEAAENLLIAIRSVMCGGTWLSRRAISFTRDEVQGEKRRLARNISLSQREQEVLRLVAEGGPNKNIAKELGISVRTVRAHLENIFSKLEANDRTHAATIAIREGII